MKTSINYKQTLLNTHIRKALDELGYGHTLIRKFHLEPYSAALSLNWKPDYTITTFEVAKLLKIAPSDLTAKITKSLKSKRFVKRVQSTGPYVNLALTDDFVIKLLEELCSPKSLPSTKKTTLFEIGNVSIGEHIDSSLLSCLAEATMLSRILERYNKPSKVILRLDDWGFSAASIILGKTSGSTIPIRKIRQTYNKLQTNDKNGLNTYTLLRQRWLVSIRRELRKVSSAEIQFIGNYDIHNKAVNLINILAEQSGEIVKDGDSNAVYIQGNSVVPLISQDGHVTTAGYDLYSLLISGQGDVEKYVIYNRKSFVIPKYVIKTAATKTNLVIKKSNKIVAPSERLVDKFMTNTKSLEKPISGNAPGKLSAKDRALAAKLILYPSIIREAADRLSVDSIEEYIKTIRYLINVKDSTETQSIENITVHEVLQLVLKDIDEILAVQP